MIWYLIIKFFISLILIGLIHCLNCYPYSTLKINLKLLRHHNAIRKHHDASRLSLDPELIGGSVNWSQYLVLTKFNLEHSFPNDYGENLWKMSGPNYYNILKIDPTIAWYSEMYVYLFREPGYSAETANFTQMVWKNTKKIGCGVCTHNRLTILTCRYRPPGNMHNEFTRNVDHYSPLEEAYPLPQLDESGKKIIWGFFWGIIAFSFMVLVTMRVFVKIYSIDKSSQN